MSSYEINNLMSSHKTSCCTILSVPFFHAKDFVQFGSFEDDLFDGDGNSLLTKLKDEPQKLGFNAGDLR